MHEYTFYGDTRTHVITNECRYTALDEMRDYVTKVYGATNFFIGRYEKGKRFGLVCYMKENPGHAFGVIRKTK